MYKYISIISIIICFVCSCALAELNAEKSPRADSFGYGFTALADEPAGVFFNPAGIAFMSGFQLNLFFNRMSRYDMPQAGESPCSGLFGGYLSLDRIGSIALNFYRRGSLRSPTLMTTTNEIAFTYSTLIHPALGIGANFKYTFETNFDERDVYDADIGAIFKYDENVNFGLAAENIFFNEFTPRKSRGTRYMDRMFRIALTYDTRDYEEPTIFAFALGLKQQYLGEDSETYRMGSLGFEQWFRYDMPFSWAARCSFTETKEIGETSSQLAFGFSFRFNNGMRLWRIDYGYHGYPLQREHADFFTGNHMITLTYGTSDIMLAPDYYLR
jgi:hypothetical protein